MRGSREGRARAPARKARKEGESRQEVLGSGPRSGVRSQRSLAESFIGPGRPSGSPIGRIVVGLAGREAELLLDRRRDAT